MGTRVAAVVLAAIAACPQIGGGAMANEAGRISFRFADREIVVALADNGAARSLAAMLPLTLEFEDYAGTEKISYLPGKLDTSDAPAGYEPSSGDLTLYAPWGNLAFFYRDHGYARGLVPLGRIVSGADALDGLDDADTVRVATTE